MAINGNLFSEMFARHEREKNNDIGSIVFDCIYKYKLPLARVSHELYVALVLQSIR